MGQKIFNVFSEGKEVKGIKIKKNKAINFAFILNLYQKIKRNKRKRS